MSESNTQSNTSSLARREEEILAFWNKEKIFEQSVAKPAPKGEYIFYDGPPFANGLPHYGHLLQSAIKDAIPRYRTMAGYRVPRVWGWDCHGLPVENLVEKELGLKNKHDIEQYGIEKFNTAARRSIMKDVSDWKRIIPRLGRWADMEADYKTMDPTYTESVWWAFKNLYDKGLVYEGFKSLHYCPHCGTTLSNFEVAQGYKDIDDIAVTVKLPLIDEPGTSLLIWTTTAWTLPGNTAAAVNPDAVYVKVKVGEEFFIVAKEFSKSFPQEVSSEFLGKELVGKKYLPPFDYFYKEAQVPTRKAVGIPTKASGHKTHAWKVYAAPFVTMDSGTGIVHLAPAFGAEDLELAQKEKIPLIHHVTDEGKFVATVRDFAGLAVKPKGNPRETDEKVVVLLQERGLLFGQEKIKHSYPHCWRCDTPLLNWAATSWFVKVSGLKSKLLKENAKVSWVPEHVGTGRFHNGLATAPDWAISRSRYWGAPLPVWRNTKTKEIKVAGSVDDLLAMTRRSGNTYFVMRHGEATNLTDQIIDSGVGAPRPLTAQGREEVVATAQLLKNKNIDIIFTSPVARTHETALLVQKELGLPTQALAVDDRLHEMGYGALDGATIEEWHHYYKTNSETFTKAPAGGETYTDIRKRVGEFLFELEQSYSGKTILLVTHDAPAWLLGAVAERRSNKDIEPEAHITSFAPAEAKEITFTPYPHNPDYELDLHRPYIDEVDAGEWKRIPDVFDCWFESGSMPFAGNHYPFNKKQKKNTFDPKRWFGLGSKGYPADFIAEALDQTRGWFYSLIVLGTALFNRSPYKNVITTGLILASDGQKMSKSLKNYPDPMYIVEKYGADALRYYLLSSSLMRAEDLRFQEKGVDEVSKKLLMRLDNVRSFYEMYAEAQQKRETFSAPKHVLDRWILARLGELVRDTTAGFEKYELDVASRPLAGFIDDLSTWYLRRSRDRFKEEGEDKEAALATLRFVFTTVAHVMAPIMPFFAEDLYQKVKEAGDVESVHLSAWPAAGEIDEQLLKDMAEVRKYVVLALSLREQNNVKLRQPLSHLEIREKFSPELERILADEVNVEEIRVNTELNPYSIGMSFKLTPELKEKGMLREWVRAIQGWRKEQNFSVADRPGLLIVGPDAQFIRAHREALMQATGLLSLETKEGETVVFERL